MPTAAYVPLDFTQGEDWSAQIIWTDDNDEPHNVVAPCRLDVKSNTGQTILSLTTPEAELPEGDIPEIGLSSELGLIQLHIPREQTQGVAPGSYLYDLFVTVDDGDAYAGDQVHPLIYGPVVVSKRYTHL